MSTIEDWDAMRELRKERYDLKAQNRVLWDSANDGNQQIKEKPHG